MKEEQSDWQNKTTSVYDDVTGDMRRRMNSEVSEAILCTDSAKCCKTDQMGI